MSESINKLDTKKETEPTILQVPPQEEVLITWPELSIEIAELLSELRQNKITAEERTEEEESEKTIESDQKSEKKESEFQYLKYFIGEEPIRVVVMRRVLNRAIEDNDGLILKLEKLLKVQDPREALELAIVENEFNIEDKKVEKLLSSLDTKKAVEDWLNQLRGRVNILRKSDSSADPWHELDQALKTKKISPADFNALTKQAEDAATELEIEAELSESAPAEGMGVYDEILEEEQQKRQQVWAERRKEREELSDYLRHAGEKRSKRQKTGQEAGSAEKEDQIISDLLKSISEDPEKYEKTKKNLPPYLQERLDEVLHEAKVKEPKRKELEELKEMVNEDWRYLKGLLFEGASEPVPMEVVKANQHIMRGILDMLDAIRTLEEEIKTPFVPSPFLEKEKGNIDEQLRTNPLLGALLRTEGKKLLSPILQEHISRILVEVKRLKTFKGDRIEQMRSFYKEVTALAELTREINDRLDKNLTIDPEYELSKLVAENKINSDRREEILRDLVKKTKRSMGFVKTKIVEQKSKE